MKKAEKHDRADDRWKIIGMATNAPATAPTASDSVT